jgi:hypothetical protein
MPPTQFLKSWHSVLLRALNPHYDERTRTPFAFELESRKDCREMIRYFCNLCQQEIDPGHDGSYLVRMEVYAAQSPEQMPIDDDRDHLEEFNEVLERYEEFEEDGPFLGNTNHRKESYHLCHACGKQFLQNPLGQRVAQRLEMSKP